MGNSRFFLYFRMRKMVFRQRMKQVRSTLLPLALCAAYGTIIYVFLSESYIYGHDPGNFYLATRYGWDIADQRPHSPGYPWFVVAFRFIAQAASVDEHQAMLIFNAIMAALALWLVWLASKRLFAGSGKLIPPLLFATNPVVLYYSAISEIYIYDAALVMALLIAVLWAKDNMFLPIMFVIGFLGGFRFTSVGLLFPALIFLWYYRKPSRLAILRWQLPLGIVAFLLGTMAWLLPYFILPSGDLSLVRRAIKAIQDVQTPTYQQLLGFGTMLMWSFGSIILVFLVIRKSSSRRVNPVLCLTVLAIIALPVAVFSLGHYAKGYVLLILPVLILLLSDSLLKRRTLTAASIIAILNLAAFFFVPFVALLPESSLPKESRPLGERLETVFRRAVSNFAPTLAHIRTTDRAVREALQLVRAYTPPGSTIVFDPSSPYAFYPRALQIYMPERDFIYTMRDTIVNVYRGITVEFDVPFRKTLHDAEFYYMLDAGFPPFFGEPPQSTFIVKSTYLALYKTRLSDTTSFMDYLTRKNILPHY